MKPLVELTTDDCLDIADLLRSRIANMSKQRLSEEDIDGIRQLEKEFRKLSKADHWEKFVVIRSRE